MVGGVSNDEGGTPQSSLWIRSILVLMFSPVPGDTSSPAERRRRPSCSRVERLPRIIGSSYTHQDTLLHTSGVPHHPPELWENPLAINDLRFY